MNMTITQDTWIKLQNENYFEGYDSNRENFFVTDGSLQSAGWSFFIKESLVEGIRKQRFGLRQCLM